MTTKITFLGTASAVPDKEHHNTHFVIESGDRAILVDCAGNPVVRLGQAGIDPLAITDLILTHFHPDHVSGVPLLLMDLWLMGRKKPLLIHGLEDVLDRIKQMMALFEWQKWVGFYPVHFLGVDGSNSRTLIDSDGVKINVSLVCHMIPSIGFEMIFPDGRIVYSSDTGPCESVVRLAQGADVLIHEATGEGLGHSSPEQAGQIAEQAGVKTLYLIHYPPDCDIQDWEKRAKSTFSGNVVAARDLMTVEFP